MSNITIYRFALDMTPGGVTPVVHLSQYDEAFQLEFTLYSRTGELDIPSGATAMIEGTKLDGKAYSANATISGNVVTVAGDVQISAVAGNNPFQIVLKSGNSTVGSANFTISVERAAMDYDTVSDSKLAQIQDVTATAAQLTAAAENVTDGVETFEALAESVSDMLADITDDTLSITDKAADAAAVGNALAAEIAPKYSTSATYAVGDYVLYNNALYRCNTAITTAESWTAAHWTAVKVGSELSNLKSDLNSVVKNYDHLSPYLYKKNNWINDSGADATLSGYDTYKIPCSAGDIIRFSWSSLPNAPWGTSYGNSKAIKIESTTNTYTNISTTASPIGRIWLQNKEAILIIPSDSAYVTLVILAENVSAVKVERNTPFQNLVDDKSLKLFDSIYTVDSDNAITTQFYWNYSSGDIDVMGNTVKVLPLKVKQGDIFTFGSIPTGLSYRAAFRASDGTVTRVGTIIASPFVYTVPSDGVLCVFCLASGTSDTVRNPKKQIVLDAKNIENLPFENQYNGLNGVAFGTSLTYNASIGNGYLNTLTVLSGMTIDNQGVGSSVIKGDGGSLDMLAKIKAYTSYSNKRVCILEGFVNDWYGQNPLGTYTDTTEDTVCGCVRSALNYMLTQKANMTVCLILDHYGRNYNYLDCSSTAVRGGKTQYEYYEEIAKVGESLGIPVIKEYALSGISELMPQYLADNIHLNALGATQSGNVIWKEMFSHAVNAE